MSIRFRDATATAAQALHRILFRSVIFPEVVQIKVVTVLVRVQWQRLDDERSRNLATSFLVTFPTVPIVLTAPDSDRTASMQR